MKKEFIEALEGNNLEQLKTISKSDLHNHATRGGNITFIEKWSKSSITKPPQKFSDLMDMQNR